LSGVVGDTAYRIVANADVSVLASGRRTKSDSTGAFYLDIKPGTHVVRVVREGYAPQMLSVTVPQDSGRRIAVWLTPDSRSTARYAAVMEELSARLLRRNPAWSRIMSREQIAATGINESSQLATAAAITRIDERCEAVIDGGPFKAQLWTFSPADIEMIEVYTDPVKPVTTAQNVATVLGSRGSQGPGAARRDCPATIFVWFRK
jgi:hypothetical protein